MRELMLVPIDIILELLVFFCTGSLLMRVLRMKAETTMAVFMGYLLYFVVFEAVAVPMTLKWVSLTHFAWFWAAVMAAAVLAGGIFLHRQWFRQIGKIGEVFCDHSWLLLLTAGVILLQCMMVAMYQDNTADAAHYIGSVSTSVYTDTLARYNPLTGALQKKFNIRYDLSAYPMHNAVWCRLLGIHPIVQAKIAMAVINVLMINFLVYQIGKKLDRKRKQQIFLYFLRLLPAVFLSVTYIRTFSLHAVMREKLFLQMWPYRLELASLGLWLDKNTKNAWVLLFLASVSALTFSGSSIIYPAVVSTAVLPVMLLKRKLSWAIPYALYWCRDFICSCFFYIEAWMAGISGFVNTVPVHRKTNI